MSALNKFIKKQNKLTFSVIPFIFFFLVCCDSEKSTVNRGHRWFERGQFIYAVNTYSHAIKINPSNPDTYFFRGLAKFKSGDIEGAEEDFTVAIKIKPDYVGAYINRGIIYKDKGELDNALADFNKVLELKPDDYKIYLIRANAFFRKGDFDKSIADCSIVINNNSKMAIAYRDRADAYYWKRNYLEATNDYLRAIELDQKDSYALNNLAWILSTCEDEKFRNGKKALIYAKKAVDLNPSPENFNTLAAAYAENNIFEEAVKIMQKIVPVAKDQKEKAETYLNFFKNHQPLREKPGD